MRTKNRTFINIQVMSEKARIEFRSKVFLILLFTALFSYGGKVDVLDPEYQKQIEEYETLLREWKENGGDYEVSVKDVHNKGQGKVAPLYPVQYLYKITLPKKVSNYVSCKKSFFLGEMLGRYFENDDFSFLSMVMFTAKKRNGGIRWFRCPIVPISEKKSDLWEISKKSYLPLIHGLLIDYNHRKAIFSKKVAAVAEFDNQFGTGRKGRNLYFETILSYWKERNPEVLTRLPSDSVALCEWISIFCYKHDFWETGKFRIIGEEPEGEMVFMNQSFFTYCAWARPFAKEDPDFAALAAGVVILDGYRFDFESGDYQLNEIGRMGVEFVAEFPHPQTSFFLKTIRNGGNQDFVDGLLQKFGNADKWNKLFGTATTPVQAWRFCGAKKAG